MAKVNQNNMLGGWGEVEGKKKKRKKSQYISYRNAFGGTDNHIMKVEKLPVHICPRYTAEK